MAKSILRLRARELRKAGQSIGAIAEVLVIAKSTVSLWCRDIELSMEQIKKLLANKENGLRLGQINGALAQKNRRIEKTKFYEREGLERFKNLSKEEFFTAGVALYLGEGAKKNRRIEFTNTDPQMIKFMIKWFVELFGVKKENFILSVVINTLHEKREAVVKNFWMDYLNVGPEQFRKMIFVKSKQKKVYENYNNYFGTLRFRILKSTDLCYKMLGFIKGLLDSRKEDDKCWRSSVVRADVS